MPRLKKYEWIGPSYWQRFTRGDRVIDLEQVTDEVVESLLQEDPEYWNEKFQKKQPPKKQSKADDTEGSDK